MSNNNIKTVDSLVRGSILPNVVLCEDKTLKVGVLRGGAQNTRNISLQTGENFLNNISQKYKAVDVYLDPDGLWNIEDKKVELENLPLYVDLILNSLHGSYGEDGRVQKILDKLGIPYSGADSSISGLAFNKSMTKKYLSSLGIKTPLYHIVRDYRLLDGSISQEEYSLVCTKEIFNKIPPSWIVKPVSGGLGLDVYLANSLEDLFLAINNLVGEGDVLVEEYIRGREFVGGVIDDFRGEENYLLPLAEIMKPKEILTHEHHFGGGYKIITSSYMEDCLKNEFNDLIRKIYKEMNLRHYSTIDFIFSRRGIYVLEVNTLPPLTDKSVFSELLNSVGLEKSQFVEHLINLIIKEDVK